MIDEVRWAIASVIGIVTAVLAVWCIALIL
jgi:hypothetical protein